MIWLSFIPRRRAACSESYRSLRTRPRTGRSALLFLCLLCLLYLLGLTLASLQRFLLFSETLGLLGRLLGPLTLQSFLLCLLLRGTLLRFRSALLLCTALRFGSDLFLTSLLRTLLTDLLLSVLGLRLALLFLSTLLCCSFLPGFFGALPLDPLRNFGHLLSLSGILRRLAQLGLRLDRRGDHTRGNDFVLWRRRHDIRCDGRRSLGRRRDR